MSRRFGKESELVKALHSKPIEQIQPVMPDQCQEEGCMSLRTGSTRLPDGSMAHTYSRGKADIYIRDKHGHFVFATWQACYMKRLDAAGLDQLSQVIVEGITAPQREMGFVAGAPRTAEPLTDKPGVGDGNGMPNRKRATLLHQGVWSHLRDAR